MKFSTNTINFINEHYGSAGDPAPNGVDDLAQKIGAQLGAVEEVVDFGARFEGVLIVKVVSVEDHPDADRLHVCKIDDGGKAEGVERDEKGLVQVVCGAPNVRADMLAAWLPPGSTVPSTFDKESFVLDVRDLRGVKSNGMLASPKELTLGDSHDGILEITQDSDESITPGTFFVDAYHLRGDTVIDIENKMFTHRPDCFGYLGIARELEGIQHRLYKSPPWYTTDPEFPDVEADELKLEVHNAIPELVPRFVAVVVRDVELKPSPLWLQIDLARAGLRSINNVVDYTNIFMLKTGQPIHAYDYDKVRALSGGDTAKLVVRHPKPGEKITLLNGKTIEPRAEAMLVAAGEHPACLGGAMGGTDTEVDEHTKNIIIEAATWDMYEMRRTAMAHGIFTDAVTRFTKGQSPLQNQAVVAKIIDELRRFAGAKVASPLIDDNHLPAEVMERGSLHTPVTVSAEFINARLGLQLPPAEIAQLLENVEFKVEQQDDTLVVTAPFWRTDIAISEDVVEEVGRLYGYDKLPLDLPRRDLAPPTRNALLDTKAQIRDILTKAGANEVLTYSFVHGNLLDKVGQQRDHAFQLANALSPDLQYYRLSLTPSLLEKVHPNIKAGYDEFALFEIGKTHIQNKVDEAGLPLEFEHVALALAAAKKPSEAGGVYYQARHYLVTLLNSLGISASFEPLNSEDHHSATVYYEPGRAATVKVGEAVIGRVGEYKTAVRRALKLPAFSAGFELNLEPLLQAADAASVYVPLPRFPKVTQDICLKVSHSTTYQQVFDVVWQSLQGQEPDTTLCTLSPVDIYQRPDDPEHKQITLRLDISSYERTLTDDEVAKLLDHAASAAQQKLQAEKL